MHIKRTMFPLAAVILILFACKKDKEDTPASDPVPDECVQGRSVVDGQIIEGHYIVAYQGSVNARGISASRLSELGKDILIRNGIARESLKYHFEGEPGGFIATLELDEVERLRRDADVKFIEPDRVIALSTCFTVAEPRSVTWNVERVGYGDGIGTTAWIIDSGIDMNHPDLTVDATKSRSFISGLASPNDANGHGTHVAGIIGGKNNRIGVLGVASGASLVSLRVLDDQGEGTLSSIIQALGYVNTSAKAGDVVNMSLGEEISSPTFNEQVKNTAARGIFIAIAAGNDSQPANLFSPGNTNGPNIYTVSAIDSLDRFASFSNYGNDVVDYAAPGVKILSTYSNGRYAYLSGTSMAAPHMAGILLLRGKNFTVSGTALNDPDGTPDPIVHY